METFIYESEMDTSHLYQGDIFKRFKVNGERDVLPDVDPPEIAFMVLNYSCDLINKKDLSNIFICPIFKLDIIIEETIEKLKERHPHKAENTIIRMLSERLSGIINYKQKFTYFLTNIIEFGSSHGFADLLRATSISAEFFDNILENKIKSLKSPWREKLGWKVGYLFNRVGLPNIPSESIEGYLTTHSIVRSYFDED